jgi:glutamate-1-semialdehyde 2,1-aminomutase
MNAAVATERDLEAAYRAKTPGSEALADQARVLFPSGVTHDSRHLIPYGIYVDRAEGSRKWDVDGNEYVDYAGGHGALLLGHCRPEVMAAAHAALEKGTHFGANHRLEVRWAQAIQKLVPSAERVRFTSSGTEATMMAVRLARVFTGRSKIVRFRGHFHGWNDHMSFGYASHFDGSPPVGVLPDVAGNVALLPQDDVDGLRETLAAGDIACVVIEPTGPFTGRVPLAPAFLTELRAATAEHGVALVFDEVVTGFRVSPGGAQVTYGITPDLTTLAKVVAGGFPGGAVVGRKEILDALDFEITDEEGREKVQHPGTFNANPVSAAAGAAALEIIGATDACERANRTAALLRAQLGEAIEAEGAAWGVYGTFSAVHLFTNPRGRPVTPSCFDPGEHDASELMTSPPGLVNSLRLAMLLQGVDLNSWPGGLVSAAHTDDDVQRTAAALRAALRMLKHSGRL